tara:strand:+ start:18348 stop:19070 length:723 start_codon:yes stop_codon:yes gene_type:complete
MYYKNFDNSFDENKKNNLTVILLAKNEKQNLIQTNILSELQKYTNELIIIDGHSEDGTYEYAMQFSKDVYKDNKKGKGDAIRMAGEIATKDVLIFIDADGSHDPNDIPKIVNPIFNNEYDHITGSRTLGGSDEYFGSFEKFLRVTGSHIILLLINYRFKKDLTDSQNGFRAIKRSVFIDLGLEENITSIEQEMIIKTLKKGYTLGEVPAHEYQRISGESKISLSKVSFRYVYSCLKNLYF